jgi:hypothetical protein
VALAELPILTDVRNIPPESDGALNLTREQSHRAAGLARALYLRPRETVPATSSLGSCPGRDAMQQGQACSPVGVHPGLLISLSQHAATHP